MTRQRWCTGKPATAIPTTIALSPAKTRSTRMTLTSASNALSEKSISKSLVGREIRQCARNRVRVRGFDELERAVEDHLQRDVEDDGEAHVRNGEYESEHEHPPVLACDTGDGEDVVERHRDVRHDDLHHGLLHRFR